MRRRTFISAGLGLGIGAAVAASTVSGVRQLLTPASGSVARGELLADGRRLYTGADLAFGTTMSVQVAHTDATRAELAIADALAAAKKIDHLMTLHRPDSQVMQLNRHGVLAKPDPHLLTVLQFSQDLAHRTNGAFDITVQPLWQTFSNAAQRTILPTESERHSAMAATGWRRLVIGSDSVTLEPGMAITLNGVAQGYAVDLARAAIAAHGITDALLDTGEFGAAGRKTAQAHWRVGIRDPRNAQALVGTVPMDGRCVATSGDYETFFTPDFLHHHIFNTATGDSPTALASVSVVAPTGLQADGWSTAFMVLGPQRAIALAATLSDIDLMLVDKQGTLWRSQHFPTLPV